MSQLLVVQHFSIRSGSGSLSNFMWVFPMPIPIAIPKAIFMARWS